MVYVSGTVKELQPSADCTKTQAHAHPSISYLYNIAYVPDTVKEIQP
jgi:hypothetical protein